MFELPLGTLKLHPKGRHDRIFLSFRFHWALLACLRWYLGTLGLPWVPLTAIGAPFVTFGGPWGRLWRESPFWRLWLSLGVTLEALCDRLRQKQQNQVKQQINKKIQKVKRPNCELDPLFVDPNGIL